MARPRPRRCAEFGAAVLFDAVRKGARTKTQPTVGRVGRRAACVYPARRSTGTGETARPLRSVPPALRAGTTDSFITGGRASKKTDNRRLAQRARRRETTALKKAAVLVPSAPLASVVVGCDG